LFLRDGNSQVTGCKRNFRESEDKFAYQLFQNIKSNYSQLKKLLEKINSHWVYEDFVYRFYHGSFKVYDLQYVSREIIESLKKLAPEGYKFCSSFQEIVKKGAGDKCWKLSHNKNWDKNTRIFLEAFFHSKYFLEMAVKYGKVLNRPPEFMPSGWSALLSLYWKRDKST